MELISDILLGAGAIGAGLFCYVLARRLSAFNGLETGVGGAIAVLSAQVDEMTRALAAARQATSESTRELSDLTARAEASTQRLELLLASLHDLPETDGPKRQRQRVVRNRTTGRDRETEESPL